MLVDKNFFIVLALGKEQRLRTTLPMLSYGSRIEDFMFTAARVTELDSLLRLVYVEHKASVDLLMDKVIRPSGKYSYYHGLANGLLWQKAWQLYFSGCNVIIGRYGLGMKARYPSIDSASYPVKSASYQAMISKMLEKQEKSGQTIFYEKPLNVALELLKFNGRDEAARFEPLEKGENRTAKNQVGKTDFSVYPFTALVIPGEGPEQYGIKLSEGGKERCKLAAQAYAKKKAPFIIVSGGYCHPFKTEYCEALEMKRYLLETYHIPAKAIIIDPHARHTTTNFRNACRYLMTYRFPKEKPALLLTTKDQADYIADPRFELRNKRELGYLPYADLKRLSVLEFSFYPVTDALFHDPIDPLDP